MRSIAIGVGMLAIAVGPGFGQAAEKLEFEVASVKPAAPQEGGRVFVGRTGGPGTPDPGRITLTNYPLMALITTAYNVKPYQVTGPGWIETDRFDVVAKVAAGSSREQVNEMLQNLLADRFKLTFHRVSKEFPLHELVVGKNGPKLKASVEDPNAAVPAGPVPPTMGKDGFPVLPAGRRGMMMMASGGPLRIAANVQSMKDLADILGNQLGTPVVDKTGLAGTYDFTLFFLPEPGGRGGGLGLIGPPPGRAGPGGPGTVPRGPVAGPGGAGPGPGVPGGDNPSDAPSLFNAVQEQLGLKLEQKKGPLDVMVIDRAEKVPTEN